MPACRSCGAPITWVPTTRPGKLMPIDSRPAPNGNVVLDNGHAFILGPLELAMVGDATPRYLSHFATCPDAERWRGEASGG